MVAFDPVVRVPLGVVERGRDQLIGHGPQRPGPVGHDFDRLTALRSHGEPSEVVTDRAWALLVVVHEVLPAAFHDTSQYANNRIETDHGRLKARLRPMRGPKRDYTARVIVRGHALVQNLRRGHYELGCDARAHRRIAPTFTELARTI
jgi:hypothetical protein